MKKALFLILLSIPAMAAPKRSAKPLAPTPVISVSGGPVLTKSGTGFSPPGMYDAEPTARSIVYVAGGRWPNPKSVSVCWINPEQGPDIVNDFQSWLTNEYARAGIGFAWGGKCTQTNQPNQIRAYLKPAHQCVPNITASGGGLSFIGPVNAQLGGVEGPGTLNVSVCRDVKSYPSGSSRQWFIDYERATVTHEFGHAMGLAHEQERTDSPLCNDQRGTLPDGGAYKFVTAFDILSIMGYCHSAANPNHLSDGDIKGLNYLYPNNGGGTTPPPGGTDQPKGSYTIHEKLNGYCLDVQGSATGNGTQVQQYPCNRTAAQSFWALDGGNGLYMFKNTNSNRCLDIWGQDKADGARLRIGDCNGGDNQKFQLVDAGNGAFEVIAKHSGKCLDADQSGGYAQQWQCNKGQPNQSWTFGAVGADESHSAAELPILHK